jgi:hypothetical protein
MTLFMTNRFRDFGPHIFEHLGVVAPERSSDGEFLALMPQARYRCASQLKLHAYGAGPFCRFRIGRKRREAGLYVLTLDDTPVYAGECVDVGKRWGPNGYGGISPRNCFQGANRPTAELMRQSFQRY